MKKIFNIMTLAILFLSVVLLLSACSNAPNLAPEVAPLPMDGAPAMDPPPAQPAESPPVYDHSQKPSTISKSEQPIPLADEEYLPITENMVNEVNDNPLLTFSLKVDTASYRNVVRYLESGNLPPADAVRIEEMINYFNYDEPLEKNDSPFAIYSEIGPSPFDPNKDIAFVRVKSEDIDRSDLPKSNLTFLIDTSGSMNTYDKLPLLKSSFSLLVETLTEDDIVSIVTYAGKAGVVLNSVSGDQKDRILKAINDLEAGGSTAGADGINTAYDLAEKNFIAKANNRVILATDGDFNVGVSSVKELERLISNKRSSGIYLTILGFGTENLKDNKMETLAKNGNGNYSYIDSVASAKKVLVDELGSNLYTIADDVKAQIEFNPALIQSYRLIGYENRMLADKDFADDTKDAGEIGVGTDVVLMFEITRAGSIPLKYQASSDTPRDPGEYADELFEVKIRYKDPGKSTSKLIVEPVKLDRYLNFNTNDFNFAVSIAAFGHLLKNSTYKGSITPEDVMATAKDSLGKDRGGYRREFITTLAQYISLAR
ncbi:MAG: VWA domain-containing protein [Clostridiales bacterium]|nr:VWA domain-containing protein [Clostridiales bacterium]